MRCRKSVGKSLDDYANEVNIGVEQSAFQSAMASYLKAQRLSSLGEISPEIYKMLFDITSRHVIDKAAAKAMKRDKIAQDWDARSRLIKDLNKRLMIIEERVKRSQTTGKWPLTSLLARSIGRRIRGILREIDCVSEFQRVEKVRFRLIRSNSNLKKEYAWLLDEYLKCILPKRKQQERDLIIAATLLAAHIESDQKGGDIVGRIPMKSSRARRAFEGVEMVVPWHEPRKRQ
jgi:hypothetical protein